MTNKEGNNPFALWQKLVIVSVENAREVLEAFRVASGQRELNFSSSPIAVFQTDSKNVRNIDSLLHGMKEGLYQSEVVFLGHMIHGMAAAARGHELLLQCMPLYKPVDLNWFDGSRRQPFALQACAKNVFPKAPELRRTPAPVTVKHLRAPRGNTAVIRAEARAKIPRVKKRNRPGSR